LEAAEVTERENILARVRSALNATARLPGGHRENEAKEQHHPPSHDARRWLPAVGTSFEERLGLFRRNAAELKAQFHLVDTRAELYGRLGELKQAEGWRSIGAHAGDLADSAVAALGLQVCRTDQAYEIKQLESCDAGITECDALIAQTGSVLVTGRSAGGRALSVLPEHHVVLARREQLLGDLPEAFALLKKKYSASYPSFISLITGPSRTGDIERILVLGAHGPKKLTILCL
jgi:L-lactate dehydrogenase complex protein LldG